LRLFKRIIISYLVVLSLSNRTMKRLASVASTRTVNTSLPPSFHEVAAVEKFVWIRGEEVEEEVV